MKRFIVIGSFVGFLLISPRAEAQSSFSLDSNPTTIGIGGGTIFGRGSVMAGFGFDLRHGYALNTLTPSINAYATIAVRLAPSWYLLNNLGGGVVVGASDTTWNARVLLTLTGTTQIALRASFFASWTPHASSSTVSVKAGPFIRLGDTGLRLYPYLSLVFTVSAGNPVNAVLSPGCSLFFFL